MRHYLTTIIALFLLSSCGEEDPTKKFIGKWNITGDPTRGIVIQEGGKGFEFGPKPSKTFTWSRTDTAEGTKLELNGEHGFLPNSFNYLLYSLEFEGAYLKGAGDRVTFERAK